MRFDKRVQAVIGFALGVIVVVCILPLLIGDDLSLLQNQTVAYHFKLKEDAPSSQTTPPEEHASAYGSVTVKHASVEGEYCLIGDSRTKGLHQATGIGKSEHFHVIAEVGMGYDWMIQSALPEAARTGCTHYVILLGVNDLEQIDRYLAAYERLIEKGIQLTLVTVGPVEEGRGGYNVTNREIEVFNERLYEVEDARVLDFNKWLWEQDFSTVDGIHYTDETYRNMETFLLTELE